MFVIEKVLDKYDFKLLGSYNDFRSLRKNINTLSSKYKEYKYILDYLTRGLTHSLNLKLKTTFENQSYYYLCLPQSLCLCIKEALDQSYPFIKDQKLIDNTSLFTNIFFKYIRELTSLEFAKKVFSIHLDLSDFVEDEIIGSLDLYRMYEESLKN